MIFMTHPEHGATHAMQLEVEAMKANGWKESTHAEWMAPKRKPEPVRIQFDAPVDGVMTKRRGRPPKS